MQTVIDEAVLLNLATELYVGLDPVAARMWSALTVSGDLKFAFSALRRDYEVSDWVLRADLRRLHSELLEYVLIHLH